MCGNLMIFNFMEEASHDIHLDLSCFLHIVLIHIVKFVLLPGIVLR